MNPFQDIKIAGVVRRFGPRGGLIYVWGCGPLIVLVLLGLGVPVTLFALERGRPAVAVFFGLITLAALFSVVRMLRWVLESVRLVQSGSSPQAGS